MEAGQPPPPSEPTPYGPPPSPPASEPWHPAPPEPPSSGAPPTYGSGPPPGGPGGGPPEDDFPWERPGSEFFSAFSQTLRMLATSPRRAFERMPTRGGLGRPLAFAILVAWPGILATTLWDIALGPVMRQWTTWPGGDKPELSSVAQIVLAACAPIWIPIVLFLGSLIQQLFLMLVGDAKSGYAATFRVACYAQLGSILGVIPMCGSLLGVIWNLVLLVIGLSAAHRTSVGRVLLAVFLPLILCCGCGLLVAALGGAAWLAGMRHGGP